MAIDAGEDGGAMPALPFALVLSMKRRGRKWRHRSILQAGGADGPYFSSECVPEPM